MTESPDVTQTTESRMEKLGSRHTIVALMLAEVLFAVLYRVLHHTGLTHTSLMFIGLPALLAVALVYSPKATSLTGSVMKGITLALLVTAPLLGEGFICILIAAPLFYAVGLITVAIVGWGERRRAARLGCYVALLLPVCLEGTVPALTHERAQTVVVERVVDAPPAAVAAALSRSPRAGVPVPLAWRLGFPQPLGFRGEGLQAGDRRVIWFSAAEGVPAGDLVMQVTDVETGADAGHVRFTTVSDASKIRQWMRWKGSEVDWQQVDAAHTRVRWQIDYERGLDPWWYFGPWEHAAVHEAAGFLIEANATPAGAVAR